ncbi:Ig-like domain-containing protein [Hymenobacter sp. HD11105]
MLSLGQKARAQDFPRRESFSSSTTTGFTLGGNPKAATLTSTTGTNGYLRLTTDELFQSGFAVDKTSFPAPQGFSISFEFFSYGASNPGADGFSVFLVDAAGTDPTISGQFRIGAFGGSLGYAQRKITANGTTTVTNGVSKGYIGIGIDAYGNYSNPNDGTSANSEGREGGPGFRPQAVSIRGAGDGANGYAYLTGTNTLPFTLDVESVRAQRFAANATTVNPDYRRAYIDVQPTTGLSGTTIYLITVRIQHGAVVTTVINRFPVNTPPARLRLGFAAATGGFSNIHEIRNLEIVQAPFALDDLAGTPYNKPVSLNILANDVPSGSDIEPSTVDLDPNTAGRQTTFSVPNQGEFSVDNAGNVTFTPSGTFAGVVTIPYTVADNISLDPSVRNTSNPANITIVVTGADIATSISGPTSTNPGSRITYTVNTTNIGTETAVNVTPTLQLTPNLVAGNVTFPNNNGTYDAGTGLVTFNQSTLAKDGSVANTVEVLVPSSGISSISGLASYQYPSVATNIPDPVSANNTATIVTTIRGEANIATACATPGKDGPITLTSSSTAITSTSTSAPNTYFPGVSVGTANGVSTVLIGTARTGANAGAAPLAVGDLIMIIQMQGAVINTTAADASYGTVTSATAGQYEYATVTSLNGSTITLNKFLANPSGYINNATNKFQVVRVPQYSSVTVTSNVSGAAWNGATGGVLALDVAGRTTFNGGGLNMTARGFRGGGGVRYTGLASNNQSVYATEAANQNGAGAHGSKGEGIAGTPRYIYNGTAVEDRTAAADGYATGSNNRGAAANAGGGAQDFTPTPATTGNSGNAGGGGGANTSTGGRGGFGEGSSSSGNQAVGGYQFASSTTKIIMGGGGGAGSTNGNNSLNSSGGIGGGIIILRTGSVSGTAIVQADGGDAPTANTATANQNQGGGGGGAGGTIILFVTPGNSLTGITALATGGAGGDINKVNGGTAYGPGGGGGGGVVYANNTLAGASSVVGGVSGTTNNGNGNSRTNFGAAAGNIGTALSSTVPSTTNTIGGAGSCLPTLAASLSTSTPNVTRNGNAVNPATYVLVVSNTGGAATGVSIETALTANLFQYDNTVAPTVILTLADGTSSPYTDYTGPTSSTTTPTFSGMTIPAGSTLRISFRATIASTALNNTAYQASTTVRFLDPTRTTLTGNVSPTNTFAGGGTVPGSNYAAASSTAEDVTIVRPLPVELKDFKATAVRQDAQLSWVTASELNNDRFVVERSLDGLTFSAIGTVQGKGTSTQQSKYSFTDAGAARFGALIYYRLKQLDFDGTVTFSPVRTVKFVDVIKVDVSVYPNPSQNGATLDLTGLPAGDYQVQLLDLTGRSLQQFTLAGQREHALPVQALPHGSYIVRVRGAAVSVALPLVRN